MADEVVVLTGDSQSPPAEPTVVVVEAPAADDVPAVDPVLAEILVTVGTLVSRVDELAQRNAQTEFTAEVAQDTAEGALTLANAAGEAVAEVAEETATPAEMEEIVEDVSPIATPWFAKSFSDWRGSK